MKKTDLGTQLKEARIKKGLSQGDLAKYIGLNSPQSISDWERGYGAGIPVPTLKTLIKYLGMNKDDVYDALLDYRWKKLESELNDAFYLNKNKKTNK